VLKTVGPANEAKITGHCARSTAIMSDSDDGVRRQFRVKACRFLDTPAQYARDARDKFTSLSDDTYHGKSSMFNIHTFAWARSKGLFVSIAKNPVQTPNKNR
jgi:hypothetical protein